jgi:uncharacterized protein
VPISVPVSRRRFLGSAALASAGLALSDRLLSRAFAAVPAPRLQQFGYGDVTLTGELHEKQLEENLALLMGLNEDSLLKPFREMIGKPAPGDDLGGWYRYDPKYDWHTFDAGFAPSATFGQWVSALARMYAITGRPEIREKVLRLNRLYAKEIAGEFYVNNRFPAYCYDKLVCGLIDSHEFADDPDAFSILEHTTDAALPHLPGKAIEHGKSWRPNTDESYTWDESYTMPENLFLAYQRGAGERYRSIATAYLEDEYFGPLSEGQNVLAGRHAYSHVNALSSAMQAYLTLGSERHLRAARNAFTMLTEQSFATGGWGPDETLRAPGSDDLYKSLTNTHSSFETPCGSYAHFKITRYLMRVSGDSRYGDSMERMMYNTVLGAKPMLADGSTFYYSDYNNKGKKVYSNHRWPCCSGTLPQVSADYRINTYFRDAAGVYINLYIPSTLRWTQDGAKVQLAQKGAYPFESAMQFEVQASKPAEFALNFRIPAWANGFSISVNGRRLDPAATPGTFAAVRRSWKTGDRIEVDLPLALRLEALDARHPETVALLAGPLVLFPIGDPPSALTRAELLAAKRTGTQSWEVTTRARQFKMLPFTAIVDEPYSTYLQVLKS